jgi:flavin-dependent dehydrogenase
VNRESPEVFSESRVTSHESRIYDVVIAGASFAGLAVAQLVSPAPSVRPDPFNIVRPELVEGRVMSPRVLLIDKGPIGEGVTSACGAPLAIVRAMGAEASVRQVHHDIVIQTPRSRTVWPLPEPFCTFDYRRFCELAFARTGAEFRQATVLGRTGSVVHTSAGDVAGRFLVDATGWRAALTGNTPSVHRWLAFGVETEVAAAVEPGLQFHFVPEIDDGYAWVFPAGDTTRIGVLSYRGRSRLRPALEMFLARLGVAPGGYHGGFLASGFRLPVVDGVFVAGDAAGQCLPVTGEGIRTAILAGLRCGDLLRGVLGGVVTEPQARRAYAEFVAPGRRRYRALAGINALVEALPIPLRGTLAALLGRPRPLRTLLRSYLGILRLDGSSGRRAAPAVAET